MARLLVVDDEPAILEALSMGLPDVLPGIHVDTAGSALEAMQLAARHRYSAIMTDQRMPGMNGSALLIWFGANHPATRRVIMTAFSGPEMVADAVQAGAELVILKPMKLEDVGRQLRGLLEETHAA